jgi:hypothetical protein
VKKISEEMMPQYYPLVALIYVSWITALSSYSPIYRGVGDPSSKQLTRHRTVDSRLMLQGLSTDMIPTLSTTSIDDRLASSSSSLPSQWDFINDVYLITTFSSNTDRLDQTRRELEKVNLW